MTVKVRFAPSPTGHVHIGNIRVAIFNWLFARHEGGAFLLRIEDTDRERSTPEAVQAVLDVMAWLKLDYDGEPVYQSSQSQAHAAAAESLLESGHAYREDRGGQGRGECVVFRMPGEDMTFEDEIKGTLVKKADDLSDFVIVRSNGTPVFHLANVVDDIQMGITHVIRGDDHIENTYRHVALYRALGATVPRFAHLPMIVNHQGKPYSKRDGDAYVGDFREKGFHPDALFNYLSLLGWSPGGDREKMTRDEEIGLFSLDRVKSGPAQMDKKKLIHLNAEYVAEMSLEEFAGKVRAVVGDQPWGQELDDAYFRQVCELMQTRTHLFSYASEWKYFFSDDLDYDGKAVRKFLQKEGVGEAVAAVRRALEGTAFEDTAIEGCIREVEGRCGIREGKLNQPLRIAVTGIPRGAGLYETMVLLGKPKVLARLDRAVRELCTEPPQGQ